MGNSFNYVIMDNKFYIVFNELGSEIDYLNASEFSQLLSKGIGMGYKQIYIDCKNLAYIDSIGLGNLMAYSRRAEIILLKISKEIKRAIEVAKFASYFKFEE